MRIWGWAIGLAVLGLVSGCDDTGEPSQTQVSIEFIAPSTPGQALGCADDLDRATDNRLEYNVALVVRLKGGSAEGLRLRLRQAGIADSEVTADVPISGAVTFSAYPLDLGDQNLQAELVQGERVVATAERRVISTVSPADPACGAVPVLRFVAPADGATLDGALDTNLANDLQVDIEVGVEGTVVGDVRLLVDGAEVAAAAPADGLARFSGVTLPIGDGQGVVALAAVAIGGGGQEVTAEISVELNVECALSVTPPGAGQGCDITTAADEDLATPGIQISFAAETNCGQVAFQVGGLATPLLDMVDGRVEAVLTLSEGANAIQATATTQGGLRTDFPSYSFVVGPAQASTLALELEPRPLENAFTLANADPTVDAIQWTLRGTSTDLPTGTEVRIVLDPPAATPIVALTGADGGFTFPMGSLFLCPALLQAEATDVCGQAVAGTHHDACFDGVQPTLTIIEPGDGSFPVDTAVAQPGLQASIRVQVEDPRPLPRYDYEIRVECGDGNRGFGDRTDVAAPRSSGDEQGVVTVQVTFPVADAGDIRCRATAEPSPNPIINPAIGYRIEFGQPVFNLLQPNPVGEPSCLDSGRVRFAGEGAALSANNAVITASVLANGQQPVVFPLAEEGMDRYGATLGEQGLPGELPDGRYAVAVAGQSDVGPVAVNPAVAATFFVDSTPPGLSLVGPGPMVGLADDSNGDLTDCVQTRLTLALDDDTATEICFRINGEAETCGPVDGAGQLVTDLVTLSAGDNLVTLRAADCAGNAAQVQVPIRAEGCGPEERRLFILAPAEGDTIRLAQDLDAAPGCQIEVRAGGAGFPDGAAFTICTDVDQGAGPAACGGESSPSTAPCRSEGGGAANLTCPVGLIDGLHRLRIVSTGADGVSSPAVSVRVDCTGPTVESIIVVEDDGDGCLNQQERQENLQNGGAADVTVRFRVMGIENGRTLSVRRQPQDQNLGLAPVVDGVGELLIRLNEGDIELSIHGTDAALNPLPPPGGGNSLALRVDTTSPVPSLGLVAEGQCFNAADDVDAAAGMQISVQIRTDRQPGETVTVDLSANDDALLPEVTELASFDYPAVDLLEGDNAVLVVVTDTCGNVGSAGGFDQVGGADDWGAPIPVGIRVDTVPPSPLLLGVEDARGYTLLDDGDGNGANGLQLAVQVAFVGEGAEAGQPISIRSGAVGLVTAPTPLLANGAQPIDALVTLPDGPQALSVRVADACGNEADSAVTNVVVVTGGCSSRINGLPPFLGASDGLVVAGGLQVDVTGQADAGCAVVGSAQLWVDGQAVGAPQAVGLVDLSFPGVVLEPGEHTLVVRVTLAGQATDSLPVAVVVDLEAPAVTFIAPAGAEPVVLRDDQDPAPGQQSFVQASVTELAIDSPRDATLEIDGAIVAGPIALPAGSPAALDFGSVTVPPGPSTLRVCVEDAAGNLGCAERAVFGDPSPPGLVDAQVEILDRRRPRLRFSFVAPGQDGEEGGRVVRYRLRYSATPIVTEADWQAATFLVATGATVDPGQVQVMNINNLLYLGNAYHVAIRAVDSGNREGPWVSVPVDLTLATAAFDLTPPGGWNGDTFFNAGSLVEGAGDLDGDGRTDLLVYGNRISGEGAAAVVFGAADAAQGTVVTLQAAANTIYYATDGRGVGDINGDSAPDLALVGYNADFSTTHIALYFGCPAQGACGRADIATPDAVLRLPGRTASYVAGVGNFFGPGAFNDLLVGGSPAGGGNTAFVIDGRANWPVGLDISVLNAAAGNIAIEVPEANAGVFATAAGDLDGDGRADLALAAGGGFEATYVFYGGAVQPDLVRFAAVGNRAARLANPCAAGAGTFGSWLRGGIDLTGGGRPDLLVGARSFKQIAVFDQDLQSVDCFGRAEVAFGTNFDFAGDVDRDGDVDLIVTHRDNRGRPNDVFIYANNGAGRFGGPDAVPREPQARLTVPNQVRFGAAGVGDFNGDGAVDVATVHKIAGGALQVVVHY